MKRLIVAALLSVLSTVAIAQGCGTSNPNCVVPTAPAGTSNTQAASTQFVQSAIPLVAITALSGDVVATGPGAVVATIQAGVVTAAKMAAGAAATNVGTLGGSLSGTLPNPGIAAAVVANSNLANMAAGTVKCRETGNGTGAPQDCAFPTINVTDAPYSADPTGVSDATTAINNAIAALPLAGGNIDFSCGTYKISGTSVPGINIGNGTNAAASTRYGVRLRGPGNSRTGPDFAGFNTAPCVKLSWAGTGSGGVISVNGPLQSWGIENIFIECNSVAASWGLSIISAQFGDVRNLTVNNCIRGINSTTVPLFGAFTNTDSFHNDFYGTVIQMPAAVSVGIALTGQGTNSDTDVNSFHDTWIGLPLTTNPVAQGLLLQLSDTNFFYNLHLSGPAANTNAQCIAFDYSVLSGFPSANMIFGVDPVCGSGAAQYTTTTPGAGAKPNSIFVATANGGTCPTMANINCISPTQFVTNPGGNVTGTDILAAWSAFTPSPACGTATITTTTARSKTAGKTTFLEGQYTITALGTCTTSFTFTIPNTTASGGALAGYDTNVSKGVSCFVGSSGSTTATCTHSDGTAFAVNALLVVSGVYENQ